MLNVLLVEDEFIVRKGIEAILRHQQEVELFVASACDAVSALKLAEARRPDVVITDVSMPEMDGFSMILNMQQRRLCSRFIIITGFERLDFTYQALQLQVVDYLVKPIDKTRLIQTLVKLAEEKEQQQKQAAINIGYYLQNEAHSPPPTLDPGSCRICFPHPYSVFLCVVSQNSFSAHKDPQLIERLEHFFPVVRCFMAADVVVYALNQQEKLSREEVFQAICHSFPELGEYHLGLGEALAIADGETLRWALHTALADLICRMLRIPEGQSAAIRSAYAQSSPAIRGRFAEAVQTQTMERCMEQMFSQDWIQSSARPMQRLLYYALADLLMFFLTHHSKDGVQRLLYWHQSLEKPLEELEESEMQSCLSEMVSAASPYLSIQCRPAAYPEKITQALNYIERHYREDLSLNDVAQKVRLQPTYLSHLFRKEVGCSFLHILHETRIKAACQLLRCSRSLSVEEIAKEAGYQTPNYFFKIFKKHMGMSPRKFRENELGKDGPDAPGD